MSLYTEHFTRGDTPQTEQADPRQEPNHGGGYTFVLDQWQQLQRFLITGTEAGTFYVGERTLTRDNARNVVKCIADDPDRSLQMILNVSVNGRAPSNSPAIFALALAATDARAKVRQNAHSFMPMICRTASHLFEWVQAVDKMRHWGRGLRTVIARWYERRQCDQLMLQVTKYRQRSNWSHKDMLRKSHWAPKDPVRQAIARWVVGAPTTERSVIRHSGTSKIGYPATIHIEYLDAFDELQTADSLPRVTELIGRHRFTHEMVPSKWHGEKDLWAALIPEMPLTALLKNLGRMTAVGITRADEMTIAQKLTESPDAFKQARVHPITVLTALRVYGRGHGEKGKLKWEPSRMILDALDAAFYLSFGHVEPTSKRILLAFDVSGSMAWTPEERLGHRFHYGEPSKRMSVLTPREICAAMAMVIARSETDWQCVGFSHQLVNIPVSPRQRLDDVIKTMSEIPMGGTDCSLPMRTALEQKAAFDVFEVYTDNETNQNQIHPHIALQKYREASGIPAKLAVLATTATKCSIADPNDAGMLDIAGFDAAVPMVLNEFITQPFKSGDL